MVKVSQKDNTLHATKDELRHYADKDFVWRLMLKVAFALCILYTFITPLLAEHYSRNNLSELVKQNNSIQHDQQQILGKLEEMQNSIKTPQTQQKLQSLTTHQ